LTVTETFPPQRVLVVQRTFTPAVPRRSVSDLLTT
jgi:hypothetical protein